MRLSEVATQGEGKRNHPLARNCQAALSTLSSSDLGAELSTCFLCREPWHSGCSDLSRERALTMQTYAKPTMRGSNEEPACIRLGIVRMNSRGFSLAELMLVVAILGILTVLAAPTLLSYIQTSALKAGAR